MGLLSLDPVAGTKHIHKVKRGSLLKMKMTKLEVKGHMERDMK